MVSAGAAGRDLRPYDRGAGRGAGPVGWPRPQPEPREASKQHSHGHTHGPLSGFLPPDPKVDCGAVTTDASIGLLSRPCGVQRMTTAKCNLSNRRTTRSAWLPSGSLGRASAMPARQQCHAVPFTPQLREQCAAPVPLDGSAVALTTRYGARSDSHGLAGLRPGDADVPVLHPTRRHPGCRAGPPQPAAVPRPRRRHP